MMMPEARSFVSRRRKWL